MKEKGRILWLIDAGYLFNAANSVYKGYSLCYKKLRHYLEKDGKIWRAYYLTALPQDITLQQQKFIDFLALAPPSGPGIIVKNYNLRTSTINDAYCNTCKTVVTPSCPNNIDKYAHQLVRRQQKGVDVGLATLALTHLNRYDTLILSSGDEDLIDAIRHIGNLGKQIELAVFNVGVSSALQPIVDHIHWLNDISNEIGYEPGNMDH